MIGRVLLPHEAWRRIVDHAAAVLPREAVGLLGGTADGSVSYVAPLPNLAADGAFLADPRSQFEAERTLARLELIPVAVYHSHPGGTPTLSVADLEFARSALLQLVVGIGPRDEVEMRAYRVDGGPREVPLMIEAGDGHALASRPARRILER